MGLNRRSIQAQLRLPKPKRTYPSTSSPRPSWAGLDFARRNHVLKNIHRLPLGLKARLARFRGIRRGPAAGGIGDITWTVREDIGWGEPDNSLSANEVIDQRIIKHQFGHAIDAQPLRALSHANKEKADVRI